MTINVTIAKTGGRIIGTPNPIDIALPRAPSGNTTNRPLASIGHHPKVPSPIDRTTRTGPALTRHRRRAERPHRSDYPAAILSSAECPAVTRGASHSSYCEVVSEAFAESALPGNTRRLPHRRFLSERQRGNNRLDDCRDWTHRFDFMQWQGHVHRESCSNDLFLTL